MTFFSPLHHMIYRQITDPETLSKHFQYNKIIKSIYFLYKKPNHLCLLVKVTTHTVKKIKYVPISAILYQCTESHAFVRVDCVFESSIFTMGVSWLWLSSTHYFRLMKFNYLDTWQKSKLNKWFAKNQPFCVFSVEFYRSRGQYNSI